MLLTIVTFRGRYRTSAISNSKLFVTIIDGFHLLFITAGTRITSQQTFVGLQDVFKTFSRHALKTSSTGLQSKSFSSFRTSWRHLARRLEDVWREKFVTLKTSWKRLKDMLWRLLECMSWRRLEDKSWRRLEDKS